MKLITTCPRCRKNLCPDCKARLEWQRRQAAALAAIEWKMGLTRPKA